MSNATKWDFKKEQFWKPLKEYLISREKFLFPLLEKFPAEQRRDIMERMRVTRNLAEVTLRFMMVEYFTSEGLQNDTEIDRYRKIVTKQRLDIYKSCIAEHNGFMQIIFEDSYRELSYFFKLQRDHNCRVCSHRRIKDEAKWNPDTGLFDKSQKMYCNANNTYELRVSILCEAFDCLPSYQEEWKKVEKDYAAKYKVVRTWMSGKIGFPGKELPTLRTYKDLKASKEEGSKPSETPST